MEHRCERCGKIIDKHFVVCEDCASCQHVWVYDSHTHPTKTMKGRFIYRCSRCGAHRSTEMVHRGYTPGMEE